MSQNRSALLKETPAGCFHGFQRGDKALPVFSKRAGRALDPSSIKAHGDSRGSPDCGPHQQINSRHRRSAAKSLPANLPTGIFTPKRRRSLRSRCANPKIFCETISRLDLVFRAISLQYSGEAKSLSHAAKILRINGTTLHRFLEDLLEKGAFELIPDISTGRPPHYPLPAISNIELAAMVDAGTSSFAKRRIAAFMKSPACRPDLRSSLEQHIPRTLSAKIQALIRAIDLPAPWKKDITQ